jgi:hypothetical protein
MAGAVLALVLEAAMAVFLEPEDDARYLIRRALVELREHHPEAYADERIVKWLKLATRAADREEHANKVRSAVLRCQRGDGQGWRDADPQFKDRKG